jgi:hypothetical protein
VMINALTLSRSAEVTEMSIGLLIKSC